MSGIAQDNGSKQVLLWLNTAMTGLIMFGGGFLTERLWRGLDALDQTVTSNAIILTRVETRQEEVIKTLPTIERRLEELERKKLGAP